MKKMKIICASLSVMLLLACQAWGVELHGKSISTIPDILKEANRSGIATAEESNLELPKHSLMRLHNGKLDLNYSIGSSDSALSLGSIRNYSTGGMHTQDDGISAALSKTKFGEKKILIGSSKTFSFAFTNWAYDIYFVSVSRDISETISQQRFGAWRYPLDVPKLAEVSKEPSGHLKDIKTGIFVEHFDGELIVAATMESTNDIADSGSKYSDKKVNVRLDFWALFRDSDGNPQYKKLDDLTTRREGYETVPLNGMFALPTTQQPWYKNDKPIKDLVTSATPYMLLKTATGDFNHDGYENEIAVLACDTNGITLRVYQITCNNNTKQFSIKEMADAGTIFKYNLSDYYKLIGYNGFNRAPGADVLAGDFDGTDRQK